MPGYINRPLVDRIATRSDVPVVILEGARAVGKTTAMRRLSRTANYSYVSLADPGERTLADRDLSGWLRRLKLPVIIDEAQLLVELPLAVKEYVDDLGPGNHFILTGSASIGRSGLGGADPLTRRSVRYSMSPLTEWETADQSGSVVDVLFDGMPLLGTRTTLSDSAILDQMATGGFPTYRFPATATTPRQRLDRIRADIASTFSDSALPDVDLDAGIARVALDALLRTPGGIFNASRIAQSLDLDRRTIDRYLSIFSRTFLMHWLPNLATTASRQNHSRSKVHPVDTSFSVESMTRAGIDLLENREQFGALLESHVVNQIVAASQWAELATERFYWRDAARRSAEVDLVLVDETDRVVGIEVKASATVTDSDLRGLRALSGQKNLHRGFVFYTGSVVKQLDERIWALPLSTLNDQTTFRSEQNGPPPVGPPMTSTLQTSYDASLFLSYVHDDDRRAKGGIVRFARDLVETYSYLYGHELQLFVDRDDLRWGENWKERLGSELGNTSFLLSAITPRYLTSEACRDEVLKFASAAKEAGEPRLILGLQWVDVSETDVVAPNDPVRKLLSASQYLDITDVRRIQPGTTEYDDLLEKVSIQLKRTIDHRKKQLPDGSPHPAAVPPDERDLIEVMDAVQQAQHELEGSLAEFKESFDAIGAEFQNRPPVRITGTYGAAAQMAKLGEDLSQPVTRLDVATRDLGSTWQMVDSAISRTMAILRDLPDPAQRQTLHDSLDGMARALQMPGADAIEQQLSIMGNVSRHLQPFSRSVTAALRLVMGIRESAIAWRDRLVD
jgi:predicted AAA+ superfamily ATPase